MCYFQAIIMDFVELGKFVESCLEWEHPVRSILAFVVFMTVTYYFEPVMVPVAMLLVFVKNYLLRSPNAVPGVSAAADDASGGVGGSLDYADDDDDLAGTDKVINYGRKQDSVYTTLGTAQQGNAFSRLGARK
jgi:hypothetical protein